MVFLPAASPVNLNSDFVLPLEFFLFKGLLFCVIKNIWVSWSNWDFLFDWSCFLKSLEIVCTLSPNSFKELNTFFLSSANGSPLLALIISAFSLFDSTAVSKACALFLNFSYLSKSGSFWLGLVCLIRHILVKLSSNLEVYLQDF